MVDHALQNGWDHQTGGFYDEGYYFKGQDSIRIIRDTKNWWAQAEGLNTLLLFSDMYPEDPLNYYEKFRQLWDYADTYLIDHEHGDWYSGGLDKQPNYKTAPKGNIWKGIYHHYRSLTNCIERLRGGESTTGIPSSLTSGRFRRNKFTEFEHSAPSAAKVPYLSLRLACHPFTQVSVIS
jgi:mannobiose 2-epimerase